MKIQLFGYSVLPVYNQKLNGVRQNQFDPVKNELNPVGIKFASMEILAYLDIYFLL